MNDRSHEHLSAQRLQALLEGELPSRDAAHAEEHLAGCTRCSAELDAWRVLLEDLDGLPPLQPEVGFAERVMAGVSLASAPGPHLDAGLLQDYLDGALVPKRAARVETHLAACSACTEEVEAWAGVIARLESLERFAPAEGFRRRVLAGVDAEEALPLAARVRSRFGALLPTAARGHLGLDALHSFVDGALRGRKLARAEKHLAACTSCSEQVVTLRDLFSRLERLERYEPSPGFAERVLMRLKHTAPARVAAPVPVWARALAVARRFVPRTRRAWAAISGVAVTPATIGGVVLYAVFSHPTVTLGSLASFLWWQVSDLASSGWAAVSTVAIESAEVFGIYAIFGSIASAPLAVAGGVLAYSLVSAFALRVLYRNIIANRPMDGRYVRVSHS